MRKILPFSLLLLLACNKYSNQLPQVKADPSEIIKTVFIDGEEKFDVIFKQDKIGEHDTVRISIRNTSGARVENLKIVLELCKAIPHNYDNCYQQIPIEIDSISANGVAVDVYEFVDKKLSLDASLVNIEVLSMHVEGKTNLPTHPLAGVYGNSLLRFIDTLINDRDSLVLDSIGTVIDTIKIIDRSNKIKYYGDMRGYVTINGSFILRVKADGLTNYNLTGKFIDTAAISNGRILKDDAIKNIIRAVPIATGKPTLNLNTDGQLSFSLYPETPLEVGNIDSISVNTVKK